MILDAASCQPHLEARLQLALAGWLIQLSDQLRFALSDPRNSGLNGRIELAQAVLGLRGQVLRSPRSVAQLSMTIAQMMVMLAQHPDMATPGEQHSMP